MGAEVLRRGLIKNAFSYPIFNQRAIPLQYTRTTLAPCMSCPIVLVAKRMIAISEEDEGQAHSNAICQGINNDD